MDPSKIIRFTKVGDTYKATVVETGDFDDILDHTNFSRGEAIYPEEQTTFYVLEIYRDRYSIPFVTFWRSLEEVAEEYDFPESVLRGETFYDEDGHIVTLYTVNQ